MPDRLPTASSHGLTPHLRFERPRPFKCSGTDLLGVSGITGGFETKHPRPGMYLYMRTIRFTCTSERNRKQRGALCQSKNGSIHKPNRLSSAMQVTFNAALQQVSDCNMLVDGIITVQMPPPPPSEAHSPVAINVVIVLDASGSMQDCTQAIKDLMDTLLVCASKRQAGTITLLSFANDVELMLPTTPVQDLDAAAWEARAAELANQYHPRGSTNTYAAMTATVAVLSKLEGQAVVFLITDGGPTTGLATSVQEIAHVTKTAIDDAKVDSGEFDVLVLGIGSRISIAKCITIGQGLHPDARFLQTDMHTIAGDIGLLLGDKQMLTNMYLELTGCTAMDSAELKLRNVKYDQKIQVAVQINGSTHASVVCKGDAACKDFTGKAIRAACVVELGDDIVQSPHYAETSWAWAQATIQKLLRTSPNDLVTKQTCLRMLAPFDTTEATELKETVEAWSLAATEHVAYALLHQLTALAPLSARAQQSQSMHATTYLQRRRKTTSAAVGQPLVLPASPIAPQPVTPPASHKRHRSESLAVHYRTAPRKLSRVVTLVTNENSASKLLRILNGPGVPTDSWRVVVYSASQGEYIVVHRLDEDRECCAHQRRTRWCSTVDSHQGPVHGLPTMAV